MSRTSGLGGCALLGKVVPFSVSAGHVANKGAKSSSMEGRIAVDQAAGSKQASGVSRNAGCVTNQTKPNQTKLSSGRGDGGDCTTRSANHTTRETRGRGLEERERRRYDEGRDIWPGERGGARVRAGGARRTADRQRKREGRRTFPPTCAWNTLPLPSKRRADTTLAPRAIVTILSSPPSLSRCSLGTLLEVRTHR